MQLTTLEIVTLSFYAVMSVITIVANVVVILSMCLIKRLRTTSNCFIISLSCADLCIGLITIPLRAAEILSTEYTHTIDYCRVAHAFTLLNFTASIINLVVITIDRYIAILHPYWYYHISNRPLHYVGGLLSVAWITVILVTFLPLYGWGSNGASGPRKGRLGICRFSETLTQQFILTLLITILATSFLLVIPMYIRMFIVAKRQIRKIVPLDPSISGQGSTTDNLTEMSGRSAALSDKVKLRRNANKEEQRNRRKNYLSSFKAAKTMFVIVLIFLVSWLAFVISTLMFIICKQCANNAVVLTATIIIYLASAVNPFVYWIRITTFQKEVKRVWKRVFNRFSVDQ